MTTDKRTGQLELHGGRMNVSTISELSETPLGVLLTSGSSPAKDVAFEINKSRSLVASLRQINDGLQGMARKLEDPEIFEAMQPLLIMYGRPKKSDEELTAWWMLYYDALADVPMEALRHAVSEYIRTSRYNTVPVPGVLVDLAEPMTKKIRIAAYRGKKAMELADQRERNRVGEETAEQRAAGRKMAEETLRMLRETGSVKTIPRPVRPTETPQQMADRLRSAAPAP